MINTNNEKFNNFIQSKGERYYAEKTKDTNYYFIKIPYDGDCDFIHVVHTYVSRYNPEGRPGLKDKSELGGIYIYSLDLLFNTEYHLREFLAHGQPADMREYATLSAEEYYKQFKNEVSAEIVKRIEAGQFDRAGAAALVGEDNGDIKYYREYREYDSAKNDFLEGKQLDKPEICVTYSTQCDYDIDAVLEYLRSPAVIVNARADAYTEDKKAMIYKQIVRAEIHFESLKEIEADKNNPLHYQREIRRVMQAACVKTVNITFERAGAAAAEGQSITVKADAGRLGWNDYVPYWEIAAPDREAFKAMFGHRHGGDARMNEITLITHGKKELYSKAEFDKTFRRVAQ